ncbi:tRNA (N(6)-L-threonylcarbamoyladenosine(37)-C(2))-methylthiotransferase MtaB [Thermocrinis minervae]|uniref:Threonylcarbamoyladenosine tRNA methylthiotransferase MtaB n=1 Tax=Thermocrinis minervae TaxID=381751 RepID=A0A1M6QBX2_9AQUI|nr:tRNA (N(6)-L-threonylcarbamoyladenosine(37)-C(2))-methylthiotransferase MtaB [Thermocrinis minervae]SHK17655.1 threonylcarbamoyladenosine tRNA methylthiotransferase MtaB [Thermocrinis minervae]
MKVKVVNLGCRSNFFDGSFIAKQFLDKGYTLTQDIADVYIINTCTVTQGADRSSRQAIYQARRENPNALIVVTGCYAQVKPQELSSLKDVDLVVGNSHKDVILPLVEEHFQSKGKGVYVENIFRVSQVKSFDLVLYFEKSRPFLKVQEGCNRFCSFCIIPFARGKVRSVPLQRVLDQVRLLAQMGYQEVVLSGTQLTQYGWDIGTNLYELLKEIVKIEGIELIRLSSLYPSEIDERLLDLILYEEKIAPHFHLSLQSGSDRILALMERRYSAKDYAKLVETMVSKRPIANVGTDVIVGFPTETDEDFKETYKLLEELPIGYMHIFPYSDRPYTKASKMTDKVPEPVKEQRVEVLKELDKQKRKQFIAKNQGMELRAVVLQEGKLLTENYIKLRAEGFKETGKLVRVKLLPEFVSYDL